MVTLDAVLLGGGTGNRFSRGPNSPDRARGTTPPKQFALVGDVPVFIHALRGLLALNDLRQVLITMPEPYLGLAEEYVMQHIPNKMNKTVIRIVAGGHRRQDSTHLALEALAELSPAPTRVLIHDACRPFLPREFMLRAKQHLLDRAYGAWIPVVPITETLKKVENQQVCQTLDRSEIFTVQTPQLFEYPLIRSLHDKVQQTPELLFTDDASICEYFGIPVGVFDGDPRNIKLTYPYELQVLRTMMELPLEEIQCEPASDLTFTV
jgi:2-C-methyl-D-erythritol 4-phosphate cytidylyltransferase